MRRKLKKEATVEGKKARVALRVKRKGRNSNSDPAHNVKNHLTPDGAAPLGTKHKRAQGVGGEEGAEAGGGEGAAGHGTVAAKKPRAAPKCSCCRRPKTECKSKEECPGREFAAPKGVPKSDYVVEEGQAIMLFDMERSTMLAGGPTTMNEAGGCIAERVSGRWLLGTADFKGVTNQPLAWWNKKNCKYLEVEAAASKDGFVAVLKDMRDYVKVNEVKVIGAYGLISTDLRVLVEEGERHGVDVIAELLDAGAEAGMCTLHTVIPENDDKAKSLLKPNGKVPGNGELYKRAKMVKQWHRRGSASIALWTTTSKASRECLTKLYKMAVLIYGAPRRPTAISLAVLAKYYADKRAHREYLAREGRS